MAGTGAVFSLFPPENALGNYVKVVQRIPVKIVFDKTTDEIGLFVFVRDGHIQVTSSSQTLQLGRGETGFVGNDGRVGRPLEIPLFIQFDWVPLPNSPNPMLLSTLGLRSSQLANLCR